MTDAKTLDAESVTQSGENDGPDAVSTTHVLVLAWCAAQPARVGEALAPIGDATHVFGRGEVRADEAAPRILLTRHRPGLPSAVGEPLDDPFVSRQQLDLSNHESGMRVVGTGKRALVVGGKQVTRAVVRPGETLEIKGQLLFVCVRRPREVAPLRNVREPQAFGEPDAQGYVGESVAAWGLRDRLAFIARREGHVLLLGPSGSGKELAAQAIHAQSARAIKKLVARNAATFPSGLIDAELFGNVASYPNAGMPERPGLMGEADGSTLFLDEIGELPESLQTHFLRVLDEHGEYQRLGDARRRKTDLRLIAATNRPIDHLKVDLAARLRLRLELPGLNDRVEDIALLVRHLLRVAALRDREIGERFLAGWDGRRGEPRLSLDLVRAIVTHTYVTHVRELDALLWSSLTTSPGDVAQLTDDVRRDLAAGAARVSSRAPAVNSADITEEQLRAAMVKHNGVKDRVWRELGLASRFVLRRLLERYGIGDAEDGG